MMHQQVFAGIDAKNRPLREDIIQKDEIISLKIDLEILSTEDFCHKYLNWAPPRR